MRFTDTVRLQVAHYGPGENIKLEMWPCASFGNEILQAMADLAEDLRNILDDFFTTQTFKDTEHNS